MAPISTVVQLFITLGAVVMLGSILYTRRLFDRLDENTYQLRWQGLFGLMAFFLLGYVAALAVTFAGNEVVFQMFTGLVFLFGAVFVFFVVNTGLVTVTDLQDKMQEAQEAHREAEKARKEAEAARSEAVRMNEYLQAKADEYAAIMQQCASGDLTGRMEPDGVVDAIDQIATEYNLTIDELERTFGQLKSFADEVESSGQMVQTSSQNIRHASEQCAESIQNISDDTYNQKERLQSISETMDRIAADIEAFASENPDVDFDDSLDRIDEVATTLDEVVELSEQTLSASKTIAGAAEEQAAELSEVSQRAEDLARYARPLRDVIERFKTESEHEFYYPIGPGSPSEEGPGPVMDED
ncbi:hypothetical protein [Haladaptatus sp. NG-WS-4]